MNSKKAIDNKSKYFSQFEYEFFRPFPPKTPLFYVIDPWVIQNLTTDEKQKAEELLIQRINIEQKIDERWLWGLKELKSEKGLILLKKLFSQEKDILNKILIADTILALDQKGAEIDFIIGIIKSSIKRSIKIKALWVLYPLFWIKSEKLDLHELITDTLFNSMTDHFYDVRKTAYNLLIKYFDLKYFTSKRDPILTLLKKINNQIKYKEAVRLLKEKIASKEIYPFTHDKYIQIVNEITNKSIGIDINSCKICKNLPDTINADIADHEAIPQPISKLENIISMSGYKNCIKRCPICNRLYRYEYHYMYYITESEENEILYRCGPEGAIKMIDEYLEYHIPPRNIIRYGEFIVIE